MFGQTKIQTNKSGASSRFYLSGFYALSKREFDIAICGVLHTPQMAKKGKNR